jgi:hypothetical protein
MEQQAMGGVVFCYSGDSYAQRPIGFVFDGEDMIVSRVLTEVRLPDGKRFTVLTEDGHVFDLYFFAGQDLWRIVPSAVTFPAN